MSLILVFNPGSNSLKFELVRVREGQRFAAEGEQLWHGAIEDIGKKATFELFQGADKVKDGEISSADFTEATNAACDLLADSELRGQDVERIDRIALRVVHGGDRFASAVRLNEEVLEEIDKRKKLAPLHNANSQRILDVMRRREPEIPVFVVFDTAFHHSIPECAWRYPLPRELADKHGIRKFGFHGISHNYMLHRYAQLTGRPVEVVSIVTTHLESGSSAAAIRCGKSVDTSMGFTPLEGLMMGTRSGSIDPAILPFLMEAEGISAEDALTILEKKSGLLGVSGVSLDTRILRKRKDGPSRQAIEIFAYKVKQWVGAYLAVLGDAEAIIFGGGIGENTPEVRTAVCRALAGWGLVLDEAVNAETMAGDVRITTESSKLAAWVLHTQEGLQLAHECAAVD